MMRKYLQIGLKLFVILGLLSVGVFAQESALSATRWSLTEINGRKIYDSKAYMEINQNKLGGHAGCNQMYGDAVIAGKNIKFKNIATTKMFCSENVVMKLEYDFIAALEKVTRFKKSGNNLSLYARNRVVLRFKASKSDSDNDSSLKLEDKKWVLESIKNRNLPQIEINPFINFDKAKRSAGGNTGCNVFGGSYTAAGETIRIFDIISTMRACIEDERMDVEREFKNGLQAANRYQIKGRKLNLYRNKTLLLTFRAENK